MALPEPTTLAFAASVLVAALSATMAYLGWKSYRATDNSRLMFVVIAFTVFVLKSLFVAYSVTTHVVPHDAIELVSALFDLIIVGLVFVPFLMPGR